MFKPSVLSSPDVHRGYLLQHVVDRTLYRSNRKLAFQTVKIVGALNSYIYLLVPFRNVVLSRCRQSTVVLGPISGILRIEGCDGCTVIAPAVHIMASRCRRCCLFVRTPCQPVILNCGVLPRVDSGSSRNHSPRLTPENPDCSTSTQEEVVLAPYNTNYAQLPGQLKTTDFPVRLPDLWNRPMGLFGEKTKFPVASLYRPLNIGWKLLPPVDFYKFTIPFKMVSADDFYFDVPDEYVAALRHHAGSVVALQRFVLSCDLRKGEKGDDEEEEVVRFVGDAFRAWLTENALLDEMKQLADLTVRCCAAENSAKVAHRTMEEH